MTRETWAGMTGNEQRIKVAELCGYVFKRIRNDAFGDNHMCASHPDRPDEWVIADMDHKPYPSYINDLNAMHEAEKHLPDVSPHSEWGMWLSQVCGPVSEMFRATASQRAEAFVLTMEPE